MLSDLYEISLKLNEKYKNFFGNSNNSNNISFFNKDFLEVNFDNYANNASFILANCKTFPKLLMKQISERLTNFRKGCILITTTQTMNDYDESWKIIDILKKNMSWGTATIYIHVKK